MKYQSRGKVWSQDDCWGQVGWFVKVLIPWDLYTQLSQELLLRLVWRTENIEGRTVRLVRGDGKNSVNQTHLWMHNSVGRGHGWPTTAEDHREKSEFTDPASPVSTFKAAAAAGVMFSCCTSGPLIPINHSLNARAYLSIVTEHVLVV